VFEIASEIRLFAYCSVMEKACVCRIGFQTALFVGLRPWPSNFLNEWFAEYRLSQIRLSDGLTTAERVAS
jgi:hypothetical protein